MVWHLAWKECQKTHGLGILGAEGGGRLARKAEKEREKADRLKNQESWKDSGS